MIEILLSTIDMVVFFILTISVVYLLIFAIASIGKQGVSYPKADKAHRIAVLFPAYKEDAVIESAVSSFLKQKYPQTLYDIIVISDQMKESTNEKLCHMGVHLLKANYKDSSKAKALQLAIDSLPATKYDIVVVMDGDNMVENDFLEEINKAYDSGCIAIQAHRIAKSRSTSTAVLDAISEEINNSIFRKGHVKLGLSSALIGSGMAFDFQWFKENIYKISTAGEDKELEKLLLQQHIYIEYLEHVYVYDEKVSKDKIFYQQRRRWIASQYGILFQTLADFFPSAASLNWDYCNKIIQWTILPRSVLLLSVSFFALLFTFYNWVDSIKWWILLFSLLFTLCLSVPDYLVDKQLVRSIKKIPWLSFLMFLNFFRLKGVNKKFIHTEHKGEPEKQIINS